MTRYEDEYHSRRYKDRSRSPSPYRNRPRSEERSRRYADHERRRPRSSTRRRRRSDSPPDRRDERRDNDARYRRRSPSRSPIRQSKALPPQNSAFQEKSLIKTTPPPEKQKPNFVATGRLAAESNTINSADGQAIILKYHEPTEARKPPPKDPWRMYVFKGSDVLDTVELGLRSCWLFGRERTVADFTIEHPSCSKQHAVIQFRYVEKRNEFGDRKGKVRPYVIDLESGNGTTVNGDTIPAGRYVELRDKDMLKFGHSSREYVLMLPPAG